VHGGSFVRSVHLIHFIMKQNASFRLAMHITLSAQCQACGVTVSACRLVLLRCCTPDVHQPVTGFINSVEHSRHSAVNNDSAHKTNAFDRAHVQYRVDKSHALLYPEPNKSGLFACTCSLTLILPTWRIW